MAGVFQKAGIYHRKSKRYLCVSRFADAVDREAKKKEPSKEPVTYERLLLSCLRLGMTVKDVDDMEIGMLMDIIITNNNIIDADDKPKVRQATQADFDRF